MRLLAGVLTVGALAAGPASAAGFAIFEAGSRATGMGGAYTAQASDGSSMFFNPAGTADNDKLTAMLGVTLIKPFSSFEGSNPYPGAGYKVDQKDMLFFPPNFYVNYPVGKGVNISLGTWFPYGLSTAWKDPDNFAGRYLSQRIDLRQYSLGLQVSARLADWIAIGAGPELRIGDVKLQRDAPVLNPYTNRMVDAAHVDIVGNGFSTDLAWGAGIQLKPTKSLRLGVAYHSAVDQKYKGDSTFYPKATGYPDLDLALAAKIPFNTKVPTETTIQYPSLTIFGVSYDITDKVTIEADANYTTWNVFDKTVLSFSTVNGIKVPDSTLVHNWKNTWTYRLGLGMQTSTNLNLGLGVLYDQTPQPDQDVSPLLPDNNRTGYSIGASLKIGQSTFLDASNLFLFFHQRNTNGNQKDNYNGTYKTFADLFVLNFRTSF